MLTSIHVIVDDVNFCDGPHQKVKKLCMNSTWIAVLILYKYYIPWEGDSQKYHPEECDYQPRRNILLTRGLYNEEKLLYGMSPYPQLNPLIHLSFFIELTQQASLCDTEHIFVHLSRPCYNITKEIIFMVAKDTVTSWQWHCLVNLKIYTLLGILHLKEVHNCVS